MHSFLTEANERCHTSTRPDHDEWGITFRNDEVALLEEHPHPWVTLFFTLEVIHEGASDELRSQTSEHSTITPCIFCQTDCNAKFCWRDNTGRSDGVVTRHDAWKQLQHVTHIHLDGRKSLKQVQHSEVVGSLTDQLSECLFLRSISCVLG